MGGGGKGSTSTQSQTVSIPPEVLARYNAVNARAENVAQQPFQQYGGEFVAPLTPTQTAGIEATSKASQLAQPYYGAATGAAIAGAMPVNPQGLQVNQYMNPFTQSVVGATQAAMGQQQGQQLAQQQAESIRAGAFGGDRAGLQRQALRGQQGLAQAQAIAPLYQQGYQQALQTAQQQQGVGLGAQQANRQAVQQLSQQLGGLGTGAQQAALQGAQAQIGAGTLQQQTQQAQDTAQYQQFLQQRGYDFQVAQFLANIAMGTGALSGSTTSGTATQPRGFFSNRGGFKTGESLHRAGKAYGGGLDPNSMGGAVYQPGAFERGGYATQGAVVDATDLAAILAQQRQSFGPFAAAGPYGQAAGATPHGPGGIVPQQQMHVPKLMVASAMSKPKAPSGAGSDLGKVYSLANEATTGLTGKGLTERAGEKMGLRDSPEKIAEAKGANMPGASANATTGSQNPSGGVVPTPAPKDPTATSGSEGLWDQLTGFFKSEGGGIMPRHRYADGGSEDSQGEEAIPYDPSDVQGTKDPMEGVLKAGSQKHEMLKPANLGGSGGGGGGGSSKLGLGKLAGSAIGSAFGPLGSMAGGMLGGLLPFNEGGVVPRQHHADGERANSNLPIDAEIVERAPGLDPNVVSDLRREEQRPAAIPQDVKGLVPAASAQKPDYRSMAHEAALEYGVDPVKFRNVIQGESGFAPQPGDDNSSGGLLQFHIKGASAKYPHAGVGDAFIAEKAPELHKAGSPEEKLAFLNDPNNQRDLLRYGAQHISKNGWGDWTVARQLGYAGDKTAPRPPNDIGRSPQGEGLGAGKPASFIDGIGFNKQTILPLLQGIGAMASSKSISPWAAALQGLGAGAKAYGEEETRQAGVGQTNVGTLQTAQDVMRKSVWNAGDANAPFWVVQLKNGKIIPLTKWAEEGGALFGEGIGEQYARLILKNLGATGNAKPSAGETSTEVQGGTSAPKAPAAPAAPQVGDIKQPPLLEATKAAPPIGVGWNPDTAEKARTAEQNARFGFGGPQAKKTSDTYAQDVNAAASAARSIAGNTNEAAALVADAIHGGSFNQPGLFAPITTSVTAFGNDLAKRITGQDDYFGGAKTQEELLAKLATLRASMQASAAGQKAFASLESIFKTMPNQKMTGPSMAENMANIMVEGRYPLDQQQHMQAYGKVTNGSYTYAGDHFDENNSPAKKAQERSILTDMMLHDPIKFRIMTAGKATPEQIEEYFQNKYKGYRGMYRYFGAPIREQ